MNVKQQFQNDFRRNLTRVGLIICNF